MNESTNQVSLIQKLIAALEGTNFPERLDRENEHNYTSRIVRPFIERLVTRLDIAGLTVGGDGGTAVHAVYVMGLSFYPDVEVSFRGSRLLAIECKFIKRHRQHQITTALGQATIYLLGGYKFSAVLLFDGLVRTYEHYEVKTLIFGSDQLRLIVKRRNHVGQFIKH